MAQTISIAMLKRAFDAFANDVEIPDGEKREHWAIFYLHLKYELAQQARQPETASASGAQHGTEPDLSQVPSPEHPLPPHPPNRGKSKRSH